MLKLILLFAVFSTIYSYEIYDLLKNGTVQSKKIRPDSESFRNDLFRRTEDPEPNINSKETNDSIGSRQPYSIRKSRNKRHLGNLINMIHCATDCSVLELMDYGNYCGWGGSGRSLNSIDRCCRHHDDCYGNVQYEHGLWSSYSTYVRSYKWYCNGGDPFCGYYQPTWRQALCNCDLQLINCLNAYGCP